MRGSKLEKAAREFLHERQIAYVVLPAGDGEMGLMLPSGKDHSEDEFQRVLIPASVMVAAVTHALERIRLARILCGPIRQDDNSRNAHRYRQLDTQLGQKQAALELARDFLEDAESTLETGTGVRATAQVIKSTEGIIATVARKASADLERDGTTEYAELKKEALSDVWNATFEFEES